MSQSAVRRIFGPAFRAQLQQRISTTSSSQACNASSSSSSSSSSAAKKPSSTKPIVLEKPDKFRPPSHPQKLRKASTPHRQYGPDLTAEERRAQRAKKYPNMMPPEGSFMFWFLTNRRIHVWISMSILGLCGALSVALNFKQNSPYYDLMPSAGDYLFHPFASIRQFFHVYKLHTEYTSAITAEMRKKEVEEAQKRRAYRVAHGLEQADGPGIVPTTITAPQAEGASEQLVDVRDRQEVQARGPQRYKKWFGIW